MIRKIWLHTYVQHDGDRIPWKVSNEPGKLEPLKSDDRIEEVWCITDAALDTIKRQEVDAILEAARTFCNRIVMTDIKEGETCTGFELLEHLEELARNEKKLVAV